MNGILCWIGGLAFALPLLNAAPPASAKSERPRVVVLTDIANEPDDEESLVRFLVSSSDYHVEALVATTSTWLRNKVHPDRIQAQIRAYATKIEVVVAYFRRILTVSLEVIYSRHSIGIFSSTLRYSRSRRVDSSTRCRRHLLQTENCHDGYSCGYRNTGERTTIAPTDWLNFAKLFLNQPIVNSGCYPTTQVAHLCNAALTTQRASNCKVLRRLLPQPNVLTQSAQ